MNPSPMIAPASDNPARTKAVIITVCLALIGLSAGMFYFLGTGKSGVPETYVPTKDTRGMVWIPEGTFPMGNDKATRDHFEERPAHEVALKGFWMDRKNFILGTACIVGAFVLFFFTSKPATAPASGAKSAAPVAAASAAPAISPASPPPPSSALAPKAVADAEVRRFVRENGVLRVTFTSRGGAIEKIELLREKAAQGKAAG
ncbi:MAG: formylglycine-generating enzyme family protein, partial [Verrucomicrobiota bacterium]